ncbi:MAG TPA: cation transporter dimerization domain-containing protein, partial [Gaiellaceae bacterium]|nr:cation transporter dimerization domain-containing protein [Gaiellaceae bacterium]
VYLTLVLDPTTSLDQAHTCASEIEARIRAEAPEIGDVVVHTEPAAKRTSGGGLGEPGGSPG